MSRIFGKLTHGAQRLYTKVSAEAPRFLGKISRGLGSASGIIGKIGNLASNIGSNPIALALAPEFSAGLAGVGAVGSAGSHLLNAGSHLTNAKSYRGDSNQVANNILERTKVVKDAHDAIRYH